MLTPFKLRVRGAFVSGGRSVRSTLGLAARGLKFVVPAGLALLLAACNFLPASGPYSPEIRTGASDPKNNTSGLDYKLVPLTAQVVNVLAERGDDGLIGTFRNDRKPLPDVRVGIGDVVQVSIFEAAAGGLFIPAEAGSRAGNFVQIQGQVVDHSGNISIPYAGQIHAAGLRPSQIEEAIVEKLKNRAIEPQAVVTVTNQNSNNVTVLGEVSTPLKFPLTLSGERVLDAISRAGASPSKGFDLFVTLQRGGRRATVSFDRLIREPANNIYLMPGDTVYIYSQSRTFLAFGATGKNGQIPFEDYSLSLSEAVAKAGGLLDTQADPQSVFLYRVESKAELARMGVDTADMTTERIPTIFAVNLRDPAGFLLGTKVPMRNKDILYISNAASVDISKFLELALLATTNVNMLADTNGLLYGYPQ